MNRTSVVCPSLLLLALAGAASAADISVSGFGTAGYAVSDAPYKYLRHIDNNGSFKRDSRFGLQLDAALNEQFGATLQGRVAPSEVDDLKTSAKFTWAFLSYRPSNDWLLRAGKLRVPVYLHSSNLDVGVTYDMGLLPREVYSLLPTNDYKGGSISKSWPLAGGELSAEVFSGRAETALRTYLSPLQEPVYVPIRANLRGLALNLQRNEDVFHATIAEVFVRKGVGNDDGFDKFYPYVDPPGYFQVDNALPGPGVPKEETLHNIVYTFGADVDVGAGYRAMGEYARRDIRDAVKGMDSWGAYLSLRKSFGNWTPYLSVSRLQSEAGPRKLFHDLYDNGFAPMVEYQRMAADYSMLFDQRTWAFGTSYRIDPMHKIKAEWGSTHIGNRSTTIDLPPGKEFSHKNLNVFSVSYNFVF